MSRRVAHELVEKAGGLQGAVLVGIRTGGYVWAQRLAALIAEIEGRPIPLGALDPPTGLLAPIARLKGQAIENIEEPGPSKALGIA